MYDEKTLAMLIAIDSLTDSGMIFAQPMIPKKDYEKLEYKYWDVQRTIDKYDRDYNKLRNHFSDVKESEVRYRELYKKTLKEKYELQNKLAAERIRSEERQKYLEAYMDLYIKEVKNNL